MKIPDYWEQAKLELAERDAVMRSLVARFQGLSMGSRGDAFSTLARSIVGQQISVKAAQSVWDRVHARFEGVAPASLARCRLPTLRACGLSGQKASYLKDLATKFLDGSLDPVRWHELEDEALILELTQVKGIGRWTAEIYLLFAEGRGDVFPAGDLAVMVELGRLMGLPEKPSEKQLRELAEAWRPYRGAAAVLAWHSYNSAVL